jgi:hypothetical protein
MSAWAIEAAGNHSIRIETDGGRLWYLSYLNPGDNIDISFTACAEALSLPNSNYLLGYMHVHQLATQFAAHMLTTIPPSGVQSAAPDHRLSSTCAATAYNWLSGSTATHMHTNTYCMWPHLGLPSTRLPAGSASTLAKTQAALLLLQLGVPHLHHYHYAGIQPTPVRLHACHAPHTHLHTRGGHLTAPPPPWACPTPSPSGGSAHPGHAPSPG